MTAGVTWKAGMPCRVVEHVDATREERQGGEVIRAEVIEVTSLWVIVRKEGFPRPDIFWRESGWRAWDAQFRWRLLPGSER